MNYILPHLKKKEVPWKQCEFLLLLTSLAKIKMLYPDFTRKKEMSLLLDV